MRVVKACFWFLLAVVSKLFLADAPANTTLLMGVGCCVSCILCCKFVIAALLTGYSFRDVLAKQTNILPFSFFIKYSIDRDDYQSLNQISVFSLWAINDGCEDHSVIMYLALCLFKETAGAFFVVFVTDENILDLLFKEGNR